jgi:hypothetical protein
MIPKIVLDFCVANKYSFLFDVMPVQFFYSNMPKVVGTKAFVIAFDSNSGDLVVWLGPEIRKIYVVSSRFLINYTKNFGIKCKFFFCLHFFLVINLFLVIDEFIFIFKCLKI